MNITQVWPPVAAIEPEFKSMANEEADMLNYYDTDELTLYLAVSDEIEVEIEDESTSDDVIDAMSITKSDQEGSFTHTALCTLDGTVVRMLIEDQPIPLNDYLALYA